MRFCYVNFSCLTNCFQVLNVYYDLRRTSWKLKQQMARFIWESGRGCAVDIIQSTVGENTRIVHTNHIIAYQ